MNINTRIAIGSILFVSLMVLSGCSLARGVNNPNGTSWGEGVFTSNGERIYFTSTSDNSTDITYTGGPSSSGWMMMGGQLTCASCHGPNGRGGVHGMGMMEVMEAPDIRWSTLEDEFDTDTFRLAVEQGQDPDGTLMSTDMPRWNMSDQDVADLITYLKTLP